MINNYTPYLESEQQNFEQENPKKSCSCCASCNDPRHSYESRKRWGAKNQSLHTDKLKEIEKENYIVFGNFDLLENKTKEEHEKIRSIFLSNLSKLNREKIQFSAVLELGEERDKNNQLKQHYHFVAYSKQEITEDDIRQCFTTKKITKKNKDDEQNKIKIRLKIDPVQTTIYSASKYMFKDLIGINNKKIPLLKKFITPRIIFTTKGFFDGQKKKLHAQKTFERFGHQPIRKSKPFDPNNKENIQVFGVEEHHTKPQPKLPKSPRVKQLNNYHPPQQLKIKNCAESSILNYYTDLIHSKNSHNIS